VAIIEIYNAVIELKYTPLLWQASDIVFLPKPGKDDYTDKRTFQPISLMLFLFKALERLVKWHMEEHMKPFHPDQHAFRKGHCTENALSQMADTIECGILRGESALDVFLDIKGAFDNLTSNTIANGMKQHDIHDDIIAWQKNYLQSRYCSVKGSEQIFKLVKGTGQGGILSPSLWNFVMDSFLYKYTLAGTAEVIGALVIVARPTEGGTRI
jgi:retron-type reverse transcriptase